MFTKQYRLATLLFWFIWFTNTFVYYGITFMVPYILAKEGNTTSSSNLESLYWPVLVEIPALISANILVDWSYTGRKYTIFIGHFMAGVSLIFLLFRQYSGGGGPTKV